MRVARWAQSSIPTPKTNCTLVGVRELFSRSGLRWSVRRSHRLRFGLVEVEFAVDGQQRGFHVFLFDGDRAIAAGCAYGHGDDVDFIAVENRFKALGDSGARIKSLADHGDD